MRRAGHQIGSAPELAGSRADDQSRAQHAACGAKERPIVSVAEHFHGRCPFDRSLVLAGDI
jgi:hypothetical protein